MVNLFVNDLLVDEFEQQMLSAVLNCLIKEHGFVAIKTESEKDDQLELEIPGYWESYK